jgi:glycosyltransferase involved in cell wall biosynthesis
LPFGAAAGKWYYALLKELNRRGHHVTAYAACANKGDASEAAHLFPAPAYDLRCFPYRARGDWRAKWQTLGMPYSFPFSDKLRADLNISLAGGFDILHLETQWCGWFASNYRTKTLVNVLNLYSLDLIEWRPSLRNRIVKALVFRAERKLIRRFSHFTAASERVASSIDRLNPKASIRLVPLAFDISFYPFAAEAPTTNDPPVIGLIGNFDWYPTYTAGVRLLTRLWPELHQQLPNAQLLIVGRKARSALLRHAIAYSDAITIEEDVPDILPYFRKLDVMLYAPTTGTGIKIKAFEALALGIPLVSNNYGLEGIPASNGIHASIGETDEELVAQTVALLNDPGKRRKQAVAARELIARHCHPPRSVDEIEQSYSALL